MRCQIALQSLEYTAVFDQPLFSLAQRQTDLLQACFRKLAQDFPLELSDLQAPGGATYADLLVAVRFPALRGGVEVRVDRLSARFTGISWEEEADRSMLFVSRCEEAVNEVFPDLAVASTSINVMSWLTCEGGRQSVEELLASRQQVRFDPAAVGAEKARFIVRGQLTNDEEAWSLGFWSHRCRQSTISMWSAWVPIQGRHDIMVLMPSAHISPLHLRGFLASSGFNGQP